ncbi:hypothetical protein [Yeosuana sp. AK3]
MKLKFIWLIVLTTVSLKAQTYMNYSSLSSAGGNIGTIDFSINKDNDVEGSSYLFKDWDNSARIYSNNQQIIDLNNINLDLRIVKFASKISEDSIFVFDDIYKVKINERIFSNIKNNFYEVLYTDKDNFIFLKKHILKVEPERHKITNTVIGPGRYEIESKYYIYKNNELNKLVLNKKYILEMLAAKNSLISKYQKDYKLSYSKEEDVIKIFQYYNSL